MKKLSVEHDAKEILKLAIPAVMERLLLLLSSIISVMIVGKIGNQALVAVSMCNTIFDIVQALFLGLSVGATIQITKYVPLKDYQMTGTIAAQSVMLACCTGFLIACIFLTAGRNILQALFRNLTASAIEDCVHYLNICLWCLPFMGIDIALSSSMRGVGDARTPFYLTLIANGVQILLAIFFTFVLRIGFPGVAVAYLIARIVGAVLRIWAVFRPNHFPELSLRGRLCPDFTAIAGILHYGSATMVEQVMLQLGFLGMQLITSHIDTDTVGAYQIANSTINIVFAITFGFETAQLTLVGNRLGAHDDVEAWNLAKISAGMSELISCSVAAAMVVFSEAFLGLFSSDPEMIRNAKRILWVLAAFVPITSVFQSVSGALKVGGQAPLVLVLNLVGPWCIRIPLSYFLCVSMEMGWLGLMLGLFADYFFRAIFYFFAFIRRKWLHFEAA